MTEEEIIRRRYPPMAENVILVDFDGTIAPFGHMFDYPEPKKGAIEALKAFKQAGMQVYIFTSRLDGDWLASMGHTSTQHIDYMRNYLWRHGFVADGFTAHKRPSIAIIDDHGYRFENNWPELVDRILSPHNSADESAGLLSRKS